MTSLVHLVKALLADDSVDDSGVAAIVPGISIALVVTQMEKMLLETSLKQMENISKYSCILFYCLILPSGQPCYPVLYHFQEGEEYRARGNRGTSREGVRARGRGRGRARGYYGRGRGARTEGGADQEPAEGGAQEDGSGEGRGGYRGGRPFRGRRGGRGRGARPRSGEVADGKVILKRNKNEKSS